MLRRRSWRSRDPSPRRSSPSGTSIRCRCSNGTSWFWRSCCRGPVRSTARSPGWRRRNSAASPISAPATRRSIDGGDINDTVWGSPTINVGEDAVQEFKVFRHQFDAQYGHALNAVVTVATRVGHEQVQRDRFLFRPRRCAERAVSVCGRESAVRRAAGRRIDRRSAGARPQSLLRVVRARQRRHRPSHRAACRAIRLPRARTASSRRRRTTRWPARGSTIGSARRHLLSARYASDRQQSLRANPGGLSDSSQVDIFNRSHSLVVEETWSARQNVANAFRVHVLTHSLGPSRATTASQSGGRQ